MLLTDLSSCLGEEECGVAYQVADRDVVLLVIAVAMIYFISKSDSVLPKKNSFGQGFSQWKRKYIRCGALLFAANDIHKSTI